jgi:hypothetical protein
MLNPESMGEKTPSNNESPANKPKENGLCMKYLC